MIFLLPLVGCFLNAIYKYIIASHERGVLVVDAQDFFAARSAISDNTLDGRSISWPSGKCRDRFWREIFCGLMAFAICNSCSAEFEIGIVVDLYYYMVEQRGQLIGVFDLEFGIFMSEFGYEFGAQRF